MSEGDFSDESAVPAAPTDPEPDSEPKLAPRGRKVLIIAAALVGLGIPLGVGIFAFMNPDAAAGEAIAEEALDDSASVKDLEEAAVAYPLWTRPGWADSMAGTTALELPSADDVLFAKRTIATNPRHDLLRRRRQRARHYRRHRARRPADIGARRPPNVR